MWFSHPVKPGNKIGQVSENFGNRSNAMSPTLGLEGAVDSEKWIKGSASTEQGDVRRKIPP
jgi:hypothetical protein